MNRLRVAVVFLFTVGECAWAAGRGAPSPEHYCSAVFENLAEKYWSHESLASLELKRNYVLSHPDPNEALNLLAKLGKRNIPILAQRSPEYWQILKDYRAKLRQASRLSPSQQQQLEWISAELAVDTGSHGFYWDFSPRHQPRFCEKKLSMAIAVDVTDGDEHALRSQLATLTHELAHLVFATDLSSTIDRQSIFYHQYRVEDYGARWASGNSFSPELKSFLRDTFEYAQEFVAFFEQAASYNWLGAPETFSGPVPNTLELLAAIEYGYAESAPQGLLGLVTLAAIWEKATGGDIRNMQPQDILTTLVHLTKKDQPLQEAIWTRQAHGESAATHGGIERSSQTSANSIVRRVNQLMTKISSIEITDSLVSYYYD